MWLLPFKNSNKMPRDSLLEKIKASLQASQIQILALLLEVDYHKGKMQIHHTLGKRS